jgi:hypothetical protein
VTVVFATCENGVLSMALLAAAAAETSGSAEGDDGSNVGKGVALAWRAGSAAILRLRGAGLDTAHETVTAFGDESLGDESDWPATAGDKGGDSGCDFVDSGPHLHFRLSWVLRPTLEDGIDIWPKRVANADVSRRGSA